MAVASGSYRHPRAPAAQQAYSDGFRKLIDGCLVVRKEERWGIDKVSAWGLALGEGGGSGRGTRRVGILS